ncbi:hypothetical protein L2Y94_01000 [Luteibacter aegosomatis]|uniref:hypothetical protein n=1 Tax=Luteibacter aegosomatis TaxID=2911537 RepID=UPI001FF8A23F|nr:hypothetical protein [Luteibacter aegosomatis]UPG85974.1 hypothetical protein L2Y94_01000 [Luteibacter aegosomatis]
MDRTTSLLAIVVIVAFLVARFLKTSRRPPTTMFTCGRCRKVSPHNRRTIDAWRAGKTRFFCGACHRAWLATQPRRLPDRSMPGERADGCLGVVLFFLVLPAGAAIAWVMR